MIQTSFIFFGLCLMATQGKWSDLSKPITQVQPHCAENTDGTTLVVLTSDAPVFYGYAKCHGGYQFNFTEINMANHRLSVYYSGDQSKRCLFDKKRLSRTYTLQVFVVIGTDNGVLTDEQFYLITCTYDPHSTEQSGIKDFSKGLSPAQDVTINQGGKAGSKIDLAAVDIFNSQITGSLTLGTMIKLRATMTESAIGEVSFHPLTCKASAPGAEYAILVAGCGDGRVLDENEGFITEGKVAYSPVFKTFRLKGARSLTFTCTYYICMEDCNGTSCLTEVVERKRRAVEEEPKLEQSMSEESVEKNGLDEEDGDVVVKRVHYSTVHYYINDPDLNSMVIDTSGDTDARPSEPSALRMSQMAANSASAQSASQHGLIVGICLVGVVAFVSLCAVAVLLFKAKTLTEQSDSISPGVITARSYSATSVDNWSRNSDTTG